jgi:hypothetical protein
VTTRLRNQLAQPLHRERNPRVRVQLRGEKHGRDRKERIRTGVADPGCLSQISDPNFSIPDPGSTGFRNPDPHPRI